MTSPSWARVQAEIHAEAQKAPAPDGASPFDVIRRRKIRDLAEYLKRPVIVYAVECLGPSPKTLMVNQILGPLATMIEPGDRDAFSEVTEGLDGDKLALVLQSPGGYAETSEALVAQLRSRFNDIDVIVPAYAKSAATMLALSANELMLDEHSELGPIDPQFTIGNSASPAQGILDQFKQASEEIKGDPTLLPAWVPILQQYAPSLLQDARQALDLAREMVAGWLEHYMLSGQDDAAQQAVRIARYFAGEDTEDPTRSHGRPIGIEKATGLGLNVRDMRLTPGLH